jgi:hypothetical protein
MDALYEARNRLRERPDDFELSGGAFETEGDTPQ